MGGLTINVQMLCEFHNVRSLFSRYSTEANTHLCVLVRNNYNKVKREAKFNYKRRKGLELCNITKTESKKLCSTGTISLESVKIRKIPIFTVVVFRIRRMSQT